MRDLAVVGMAGGRISPREVEELLSVAKQLGLKLDIEVLLMDAELIFGRIHIESAVEHASRAFERGINVADSRMLEAMLYASGERQLSTAIEKLGVKDTTKHVAIVVSDQSRLDEVIDGLQIDRDDSILDGKMENLISFGISREAISGIAKEKAMDLVLEKVALVDLMK